MWQSSDAGYNPSNLYRNSLARYFLPSVDEWYKSAFYNPTSGVYYDYPTGSDTAPMAVVSGTAPNTAVYHGGPTEVMGPADITLAGGLSPYGTMGQGSNVWELEETDVDLVNDSIQTSFPPDSHTQALAALLARIVSHRFLLAYSRRGCS